MSPAIMLDQVLYGRYQRLAVTHRTPEADGDEAVPAIGLSRVVYQIDIKECVISGRTGIGTWFVRNDNAPYLLTDGLQITDNQFNTTVHGIHLEGQVLYGGDIQVVRNRLTGASVAGITLVGASVPQTRVEITDNIVSARRAGIIAGVNGLRIDRNEVTTTGGTDGDDGRPVPSIGILLRPGFDQTPIGPVSVCANHVRHVTGTGIAVATMMTTAVIADNVVRDTEAGIAFGGAGGGRSVSIRGNEILETNALRGQGQLVTAIRVQRVADLQVTQNTVLGVGGEQTAGFVMGILTAGCLDVSVTDNHVSEVTVGGDASLAGGIIVSHPFSHAEVSQNIVRGHLGQEMQDLAWSGIVVGAMDMTEVQRYGDQLATVRTTGTRSVMMTDGFAAVFEVETEHAAIHENVVEGGIRYPVMAASVRGELLMSHNRCHSDSNAGPVVYGAADIASVHGNRVRGGELSMVLDVDSRRSTFTGNITSGAFSVAGAPLVAPWAALNVNG